MRVYILVCVSVYVYAGVCKYSCVSIYVCMCMYMNMFVCIKINRSFYVNIVYITLYRYINHDKVRVCIDIIKLELIFNNYHGLITTSFLFNNITKLSRDQSSLKIYTTWSDHVAYY